MEGIDCYCLEDELLLEGVKSKGHHRTVRRIHHPTLNSSCLWSVSEATAEAPSTCDNRQQDRHEDNFVNPINILSAQTIDRLNICFASYAVRGRDHCSCLNVKSNRLKMLTEDFHFHSCRMKKNDETNIEQCWSNTKSIVLFYYSGNNSWVSDQVHYVYASLSPILILILCILSIYQTWDCCHLKNKSWRGKLPFQKWYCFYSKCCFTGITHWNYIK